MSLGPQHTPPSLHANAKTRKDLWDFKLVLVVRSQVTCTVESQSVPVKVFCKSCWRWTSAVALKRPVFYRRQWICHDKFSPKHLGFSLRLHTHWPTQDSSCDNFQTYVVHSALNNSKRVSTVSYRQPWVGEFFYRQYLLDLLDIWLVRSTARRKTSMVMMVMKNTPNRFFVETLTIAFIMSRSMIQLSFLGAKEIASKSWGNGWSLTLWHLTKSTSIAVESRGNFCFNFSSW